MMVSFNQGIRHAVLLFSLLICCVVVKLSPSWAISTENSQYLEKSGINYWLVTDAKEKQYVLNDPSTKIYGMSIPRPIPTGLIIRLKEEVMMLPE